ncbi:hypothetical protein [Maribacter sp. 2307UL18-2]|uniref:hypothetical protein n=1 Tax=Maribacter sp. 2307UL18-2 TaxID=3386274 RepID=UPI0039BD5A61
MNLRYKEYRIKNYNKYSDSQLHEELRTQRSRLRKIDPETMREEEETILLNIALSIDELKSQLWCRNNSKFF